MFNWVNPDEPIVVKLPFKIYWGVSGSITAILFIGLSYMTYPEFFQGVLAGITMRNKKGPTREGIMEKEKRVKVQSKLFLGNDQSMREANSIPV